MIKKFSEFLNEKNSGDVLNLKRNKWTPIKKDQLSKIKDEIFDLINVAYAEIGGHTKIKSAKDVDNYPDWNFWEGVDLHDSPDLDLVIWGKKTKYGVKFSGVGHDGKKDSKREYLDERGKDLKNLGYYIEVSGKLAEILMNKYKVPYVSGEEKVEKVIGKNVDYHGVHPADQSASGEGWYTRKIGGKSHTKILLGKPKI